MFYLKKPCGCITLCDDTVDLTKPRTMGTGHEMVVYGCTTIKQTFQNSQNTYVLSAPQNYISNCEKIPIDSPEGVKIAESIDALIQRGKKEKQEKRAMKFTSAVDDDWDDDEGDGDDDDENAAEKSLKSLFDRNISPNPGLEASKALGIGDEIPPFPSTGKLTIDEFVEAMGLEQSLTPSEVIEFKRSLQIAQRLAAIGHSSPLTDKIIDGLKEKCCELMRKSLDEKLGGLSLGQLRR